MRLFSIKSLDVKMKFVSKKCIIPLSFIVTLIFPKLGLSGINSSNLKAVSQLQDLQSTISGPVLASIAVIMVVVTCLMLAFGEWGDGFKRLIQIVFWISIAAGAGSMVASFMG